MKPRGLISFTILLTSVVACSAGADSSHQPEQIDPSISAESDLDSDAEAGPPTPRACRPQVFIRPEMGPVGTRIRIRGSCFDRKWGDGYGMFLLRQFQSPRECELLAGGRQHLAVRRSGRARGFFIVPGRGSCFQHEYDRLVTPARYSLHIGCHACDTGRTFRVTAADP